MADEYRRIRIASRGRPEGERLLAEAFAAGAVGAEEVEDAGGYRACVYVLAPSLESVRGVLLAAASDEAEVGAPEDVPSVDWSEAWKQGLEAIEISPRLVVRPPFAPVELRKGQREIVIDPGQAFGTGSHASTQLCLQWLDRLYARPADREHRGRVLDVGTGSGVLAFAAVVLGAESALGFDLDPVAIRAAHESAGQNGVSDRVGLYVGPIQALGARVFPVVLANLLKSELLGITEEVAGRVEPGGRLILAGLLEEDVAEVLACFAACGLNEAERPLRIEDAVGCWVGLCLSRSGS